MKSALNAPHFQNATSARNMIESLRWPNGPVCHHCGEAERRYETKRAGRWRCGNPKCRKDFSVITGTVMEDSKIELHKWLMGFYLVSSSKKGMSAHQLHRSLGVTYKSAWFMAHRIREAMRAGGLDVPMGGDGKIVEADETYFGKPEEPKISKQRKGRPYLKGDKKRNSRPIVSLVERGGRVRSFHVASADKETVQNIVLENVYRDSRLHTDESRLYFGMGERYETHETVKHSLKEYVRGDVHTNSAEGYFSIFKRGMKGVYQHCKEKHLHRYLAEFDFRYNNRIALGVNDGARAARAVVGSFGKRLTYRQAH